MYLLKSDHGRDRLVTTSHSHQQNSRHQQFHHLFSSPLHTWAWTDFELAKVTAQPASTDGASVKNLIAAVDKHKQGHTWLATALSRHDGGTVSQSTESKDMVSR